MSEADRPAGPRSGIKADVSAKAELSARAELKGEIPPDVIRKGSNVLWDLLSPLTERAGLRGDQLRLQRQDVLIEIAKRVRELAAIERAPLNPIPNKLKVPLLEKASLEDLESAMLDRWAKLMLSAAVEYDAIMLTHVDILSRLGSREAALIEELCMGFDSEDIAATLGQGDLESVYLEGYVRGSISAISDIKDFSAVSEIMNQYNKRGIMRMTSVEIIPVKKRLS